MKNFKKITIFMIILILIIIIFLSILLFNQKKETKTIETIGNVENSIQEISLVKDENEYHDVERIFNKYLSYINYLDYNYFQAQLSEEKKQQYKEEYFKKGKDALEKILLDQVATKNNWTNELSKYSNKEMKIVEMNKCVYNQINAYLLTIENSENDNTGVLVFVDNKNRSFLIMPDKIIRNISKDNLVNILNEINIQEINKNDFNEVKKITLDDEGICLQYYYNYLGMVRNDVDKLYYTLDKEYREKRFGNIESFKNYINNNKEKLEKAVLSKYEVKKNSNYTEYLCVDEEGHYYIFNATAAMKYTLFLDTYTADLPEFTQKYNMATDQEKVILNINKVITAINEGDYKYFYNKLADSFKNNYFENEEYLKAFWLKNLYKKSEVKYEDFKREGNLYTYKLRVIKEDEKDEEVPFGKDAPSTYINVVMQLKEGTDFVMSFSII